MRNVILLAAAAASFVLAGCNTIAGAGRDAQSVGRAVTGTAEDAKR